MSVLTELMAINNHFIITQASSILILPVFYSIIYHSSHIIATVFKQRYVYILLSFYLELDR